MEKASPGGTEPSPATVTIADHVKSPHKAVERTLRYKVLCQMQDHSPPGVQTRELAGRLARTPRFLHPALGLFLHSVRRQVGSVRKSRASRSLRTYQSAPRVCGTCPCNSTARRVSCSSERAASFSVGVSGRLSKRSHR